MPTSAADTEIAYTGNGVTVAFPFPFEVSKASHFEATIDGVVVTAYTLSGLGVDTGGTCTFTDPPASLAVVVLARVAPYARTDFDYQEGGELAAATLDEDIDRGVQLSQQLHTISNRSIKAPRGETLSELPAAADRALRYMSFDAAGEASVSGGGPGDVPISSAMEPVVAAATVGAARQLIGADFVANSNLSIQPSASAGALTISLLGQNAAALSASNPGRLRAFASASNGDHFTAYDITAPLSVTIPSGATLGAAADVPFRVWVVAVYGSGGLTLGVINPLIVSGNFAPTGTASLDSTFAVAALDSHGFTQTFAELTTASDLAGTLYLVGSAGVFMAYTIIGWLDFAPLTPGSWVAPAASHTWAPGMPTPGDVVRTYGTRSAAVSTGVLTLPIDDTIPQSGEGIPCMSAASGVSTPISAKYNLLSIEARANLASSNTDVQIAGALFLNSDANACAAAIVAREGSAGFRASLALSYLGPNVDASGNIVTTVAMRGGTSNAGTTTFNGSAGVRTFGGRMASQLTCQEIMT